jgi:hypothetical protein
MEDARYPSAFYMPRTRLVSIGTRTTARAARVAHHQIEAVCARARALCDAPDGARI